MTQPPAGPPQPNHPPAWNAQQMATVDADPESAGMQRVEKVGWALPIAAVGSLAAVISFFLGWFNVELFRSSDLLDREGIDGRPTAVAEKELATPFEVVDMVKDISAPGLAPYEAGGFGSLVFPWLALALTALCIVLALGASLGLRRRVLTSMARIIAVSAVPATAAVVVGGYFDIGGAEDRMTYQDDDELSRIWSSWGVEPDYGAAVWGLALLLLLIAAVMGPRIVHRLPDGGLPAGAAMAPGPQSGQFPAAGGVAGTGGVAGAGGVAGTAQGFAPGAAVRHRPNLSAVVSGALGCVLCFAGYGFLPWGEDTTFSDIGEAAREYGFKNEPFVEAYFAWLGWAILALTLVVLGLLALGRTTTAVRSGSLRPILIIGTLAMVGSHAWMWIVLADDGAEFEIGAYAVGLGLLLTMIAAMAPLKTTARVLVGPAQAALQPGPWQQPWTGQAPAQPPPTQEPAPPGQAGQSSPPGPPEKPGPPGQSGPAGQSGPP